MIDRPTSGTSVKTPVMTPSRTAEGITNPAGAMAFDMV
jgi:hypothetical protein